MQVCEADVAHVDEPQASLQECAQRAVAAVHEIGLTVHHDGVGGLAAREIDARTALRTEQDQRRAFGRRPWRATLRRRRRRLGQGG